MRQLYIVTVLEFSYKVIEVGLKPFFRFKNNKKLKKQSEL